MECKNFDGFTLRNLKILTDSILGHLYNKLLAVLLNDTLKLAIFMTADLNLVFTQ